MVNKSMAFICCCNTAAVDMKIFLVDVQSTLNRPLQIMVQYITSMRYRALKYRTTRLHYDPLSLILKLKNEKKV